MTDNYNNKVNHITQSFEWGKFRQTTGVKFIHQNDFILYLHKVPLLSFYIGYLPRPAELTKEILNRLLVLGEENRCLFIKIDPNLNQQFNNACPERSHAPDGAWRSRRETMKQCNNAKSILPRHTFFIDLTKSEEELLSAMESKTRYNIKVAQKHGVIIKEGKTEKDLAEFIKILEDTEKRQGFFSHPAFYYRKLWSILRPTNMVYLLLAYPPNPTIQQFNNACPERSRRETIVPIASLMLFKFKDTLYYPYGGSLDKYRNLMPNYLLHWEAIKLGKKLGCHTYDMWGAYLNKPDQSDPWWGIYRFKSGFGGKLVTYPPSFDLIINQTLYIIYQLIDFLRWQIIRLRRRFS